MGMRQSSFPVAQEYFGPSPQELLSKLPAEQLGCVCSSGSLALNALPSFGVQYGAAKMNHPVGTATERPDRHLAAPAQAAQELSFRQHRGPR
jgi:hypothetical protein